MHPLCVRPGADLFVVLGISTSLVVPLRHERGKPTRALTASVFFSLLLTLRLLLILRPARLDLAVAPLSCTATGLGLLCYDLLLRRADEPIDPLEPHDLYTRLVDPLRAFFSHCTGSLEILSLCIQLAPTPLAFFSRRVATLDISGHELLRRRTSY